ncbi:sigma-54 interaction domain-containing protein [Hornefia butyriciproducens]|uniref:sigma-54 interaction domain-containing protein n=1 Tax=Hornefia butyriciproducens TaxID=2652293 RepID=UPI003D07BF7D
MKKFIRSDNIYENTHELCFQIFDSLYFQVLLNKNGRIIYINDNYAEFFGKKKDDIIGMQIEELIPNTQLYDAINTASPAFDELFQLEDGRQIVYSRLPVINSHGEVQGVATSSSFNSAEQIRNLQERVRKLEESNLLLNRRLHGLNNAPDIFDSIVGISDKITELKNVLFRISNTALPILLTGETGTGKEVFATTIHNVSNRRDKPFVKINCAAIPKDLVESELFGYVSGTFSGANKTGKAGKFEEANHGTVLLDEVEELSLDTQSKLLRVLQEYEVERIGSIHPIPLDIQVICCSNQDLYQMVKEKKFREDLLYRINVIELRIPPLRERPEDIPLLCKSIIEEINRKYHLHYKGISDAAISYLSSYSWPGNVRELKHFIERACIMSDSDILQKSDFNFICEKICETPAAETHSSEQHLSSDLSEERNYFAGKERYEKEQILSALRQSAGNRTKAAKALGISRSLLYDKLRKYDILSGK